MKCSSCDSEKKKEKGKRGRIYFSEKGDAFIFQNKTLTNPVGNTGYSIKKETILFTRVTGP